MLTVLIPTYHYNALPLVEAIYKQCKAVGIPFEIIVQDDASHSTFNAENKKINSLENCHFSSNTENLGRGRNINTMVLKAKNDYILLLDCDTMPTHTSFIQNYSNEIKKGTTVVFGGIVYHDEKPKQENLLRWVYGKSRESLSVVQRSKNSYFSTLTSNLLVKKSIFQSNPFNENIVNYGYEDVVWAKQLKEKKIKITHIDNPTYHLNLETSELFLKKIHQSLDNLNLISNLGLLLPSDNRILKTYKTIHNLHLSGLISFFYTIFHKKIEANLFSNHPSLFLLDIYKLGYFCKIQSK